MPTLRKAGSAFWLAYTRDPRPLFTPQFIRFIVDKVGNGVLVLNILAANFTEICARIKRASPGTKVLRYVKFQRIYETSGGVVTTGNTYFDTIEANAASWCIIRVADGQPKYINGAYWPDITNTTFRADWVAFVAAEVAASGADGVAIDSHHWHLAGSAGSIVNWTTLNANWQAASEAVMTELQAAGVPIVMFNGMWGQDGEQQIVKQGEMLASAGAWGALAEFSYLDGVGRSAEGGRYTTFVTNINDGFTTDAGGKHLIVNSQRESNVYADFADDYAAGLYAYCCYLLGPGTSEDPPRHGFHYGNFQCTKVATERSGGYDYLDIQDLRLGAPTSAVTDLSPGFSPTAPQGVIDNGFYLLTEAGLTAAGITAPASLWDFQEASGNIIDNIGALDLTPNGSPTYQVTSTAFSSRFGLGFDGETTNQRVAMASGAGPNPATTSSVWLAIVSLFPPTAVAGVISGGSQVQARMLSDGSIRATCASTNTDSAESYVGSVDEDDPSINSPYPAIIALKHDLTDANVHVYTHLGESLAVARAAVSDANKGFGGIAPTLPMNGLIYQAMLWTGATAEGLDVEDVISRLVVPITGKYRTYEGGIVLVAPEGGSNQTFVLTRRYYTLAGVAVEPGNRVVTAGTGEILLTNRPTTPPSQLGVYGSRAFSSFGSLFPVSWTETEWLVQPVKNGWYRWPTLNLRVKGDQDSAVIVRCEVDDDPRTHAILVIKPAGGTFTKGTNDYPYGETANGTVTNVYATTTYDPSGVWQDISINLDTELGFTVHRVPSVRVVNGAQLSELYLSGRVAR